MIDFIEFVGCVLVYVMLGGCAAEVATRVMSDDGDGFSVVVGIFWPVAIAIVVGYYLFLTPAVWVGSRVAGVGARVVLAVVDRDRKLPKAWTVRK